MVEANGTLEPTLESGKFDEVDGAIVIVASRWPGLLAFLLVIVLLLSRLLFGRFPLGRLLPLERDKPCYQGFAIPKILTSLFFQLFNPHF
jgi:ABC-type microcin C transport system permease subunit YejB